jgi:hypothetical protein
MDLRSIFDPKALINISWQQKFRDKAIKIWREGWERGDSITHRALCHAVEIKGVRQLIR